MSDDARAFDGVSATWTRRLYTIVPRTWMPVMWAVHDGVMMETKTRTLSTSPGRGQRFSVHDK